MGSYVTYPVAYFTADSETPYEKPYKTFSLIGAREFPIECFVRSLYKGFLGYTLDDFAYETYDA